MNPRFDRSWFPSDLSLRCQDATWRAQPGLLAPASKVRLASKAASGARRGWLPVEPSMQRQRLVMVPIPSSHSGRAQMAEGSEAIQLTFGFRKCQLASNHQFVGQTAKGYASGRSPLWTLNLQTVKAFFQSSNFPKNVDGSVRRIKAENCRPANPVWRVQARHSLPVIALG